MSDSHAQQPKKRSFSFDDIASILDESKPVSTAMPAAAEPAPVVREQPAQVPEPAIAEEPVKAAEPVQVAQQDSAIVDRLLADFSDKNAEILRLNNEIMQLKFEIKEKELKISSLAAVEATLKEKEDAIKDRDASIKEKESVIKEKEAALKEKDAILKEKETAITAKDAEIKAYEAQVKELDAKMGEMSEQLGILRKFSAREMSHEPFDEPAGAPDEKQELNVQEQMAPDEGDVASIFRRLAGAKTAEPEDEEGKEQPRKPRSAKLYDL
jgi:myosin heavy subunit